MRPRGIFFTLMKLIFLYGGIAGRSARRARGPLFGYFDDVRPLSMKVAFIN
jgi:hypothetical protein